MKALTHSIFFFALKLKQINILLMQVWAASAPAEVNGMPGSNNTGRGLGCQFLRKK